ncbi:LRMP protein, partial [Climacteris rufus]|nr:LRMP protein [Climacteris rufus]
SSPYYFGSREASEQNRLCALSNVDVQPKQKYLTSSPNLNFFRSDKKPESAVIQHPVPKTFSLSERGKVPVSKIIDYLRHITSRRSEDSGLEELCDMLDPEHKDISLDLETYHAIMGDWTEDCKSTWEDAATEKSSESMEDLEFQTPKNVSEGAEHFTLFLFRKTLHSCSITKTPLLSAKETHVWMNATSGSLEAFGGDVSKGDMETSDLITCVADLQYNNRKLREENNKLKLTLEAMDETNNKLLADTDHLHQQIKSIQRSVLKAKSLEKELEEVRNHLNLSEEKREQALWQNKQHVGALPSLFAWYSISHLAATITRKSMDTEGLQKRILELSKNVAQLQVKAHICESTVEKKEASLIQKEQHIKELKLTIVECSSIIETLRAEKNKLLENIQHMQQELILHGLNFSLLCKFNSNFPEGMNSLHYELELAQSSEIIRPEWMSLDETLDHEVLLLLQGPEFAGEKIKTIMKNLVSDRAYTN